MTLNTFAWSKQKVFFKPKLRSDRTAKHLSVPKYWVVIEHFWHMPLQCARQGNPINPTSIG